MPAKPKTYDYMTERFYLARHLERPAWIVDREGKRYIEIRMGQGYLLRIFDVQADDGAWTLCGWEESKRMGHTDVVWRLEVQNADGEVVATQRGIDGSAKSLMQALNWCLNIEGVMQ